jgi:hypothetical protein
MKYNWLKSENYLSKEALHSAISHILENYNNDDSTIDFKADFNC